MDLGKRKIKRGTFPERPSREVIRIRQPEKIPVVIPQREKIEVPAREVTVV